MARVRKSQLLLGGTAGLGVGLLAGAAVGGVGMLAAGALGAAAGAGATYAYVKNEHTDGSTQHYEATRQPNGTYTYKDNNGTDHVIRLDE